MEHCGRSSQAGAIIINELDLNAALRAAGDRFFPFASAEVSCCIERPPLHPARQWWAMGVADFVDKLHWPKGWSMIIGTASPATIRPSSRHHRRDATAIAPGRWTRISMALNSE